MTTIGQSLSALGFAPVIAILAKDTKDAADVSKHFSPQPSSQLGSLSLAVGAARGIAAPQAERARVYENLGIVYGTVDRDGWAALRHDPSVRKVEPAPDFSLIRPVASAAATLDTKYTWGLEFLEVPELWSQGLTGKGIRVAHLDTGVDDTHPALQGAVTKFAEFDWTGRQLPGSTPRDSDDREAHGTHTAATIGGRPVDDRYMGVAPGAELYCGMVIEGGDVVARILGGMNWAVGEQVRVLSMSLGIPWIVNSFLGVIDILRDSGVLPVVAVGNDGPGTSRSPGNLPTTLSVGAHDEHPAVADFSSSQRFKRRRQPLVPDVVAPGVGVISAGFDGGYQSLSGTSMATPHVAGLAALLLEARPEATVSQVERAIHSSAKRGNMDAERVNRGAINAKRALAAITSKNTP